MKLRKIALLVSLAAVTGAGLNGCRLLDDDSDRAPTVNTFTALNNYLQNATCCLDENNNKVEVLILLKKLELIVVLTNLLLM